MQRALAGQDVLINVSIHAPRFRGAMRGAFGEVGRHLVGFNPRSPFPGSDATRNGDLTDETQSGFNPRSPFPGSDAAH